MHEMSIVAGILSIAEKEANSAGAHVIRTVEIEVGRLAGVEIPALEFCFEVARRGTPAEDADLVVHEIPGLGRCPDCSRDVAVDMFMLVCPFCGQGLLEILQGRELRVRSLCVD